MSKNIEYYHELKDFFMQNLQNGDLPCEFLFKEDKDNLALHFNVKNESVSVDYYYVFGDSAIHRFINDTNEVLISKNIDIFIKFFSRNINEIINKTEVV